MLNIIINISLSRFAFYFLRFYISRFTLFWRDDTSPFVYMCEEKYREQNNDTSILGCLIKRKEVQERRVHTLTTFYLYCRNEC